MCGITGFVNADLARPADGAVVRRMCDVIRHRGPDDEGYLVEGPVALGMRRLSIIDLAGGKQPISNEDGSVTVVFNGEIYNYRELRAELTAKGHRFTTQSDTEVLAHLYEEEGEGLLKRLNAMVGMALWDAKRRRLLLARDRMGKKPLHWTLTHEGLVFGSELKALLQHPSVVPEIDPLSVAKYLIHEYVPAPRTIYRGIHKLLPGHFLIYERGDVHTAPYWDIPVPDPTLPAPAGPERLAEHLRELIDDAVRCRLISDVPLGVFLSGGIDSSTVVAAMTRAKAREVKTFSVAFRDPTFDESRFFRSIANAFGATHTEQVLEPEKMMELIPHVAGFLDEPMADASILPTYLLSRFTREHVAVALGGDGGDELFAGYPTYQASRLADWYGKLPGPLRRWIVEPMIRRMRVSTDNISLDFKLKKFIAGLGASPEVRNVLWLGSFDVAGARSMLAPQIWEHVREDELFSEIETYATQAARTDPLSRLLYIDQKMYLQDDILVKVDRASMACSLEVRAPLLDVRLVEWICRLPSSLKLNGMTTKFLLKKAVAPWLPSDVVHRPKKGFGVPLAKWIRGPLTKFTRELFDPKKLASEGLLNPTAVNGLLDRHLAGLQDNRKPLWTLMMLQLWHERWAKRPAAVAA